MQADLNLSVFACTAYAGSTNDGHYKCSTV